MKTVYLLWFRQPDERRDTLMGVYSTITLATYWLNQYQQLNFSKGTLSIDAVPVQTQVEQ